MPPPPASGSGTGPDLPLARGTLQGHPARSVTSATRFTWTPTQTACMRSFLDSSSSNNHSTSAAAATSISKSRTGQIKSQSNGRRAIDISPLLVSLGYASFTRAVNDYGEDLGHIIEVKVRRKLASLAKLHRRADEDGEVAHTAPIPVAPKRRPGLSGGNKAPAQAAPLASFTPVRFTHRASCKVSSPSTTRERDVWEVPSSGEEEGDTDGDEDGDKDDYDTDDEDTSIEVAWPRTPSEPPRPTDPRRINTITTTTSTTRGTQLAQRNITGSRATNRSEIESKKQEITRMQTELDQLYEDLRRLEIREGKRREEMPVAEAEVTVNQSLDQRVRNTGDEQRPAPEDDMEACGQGTARPQAVSSGFARLFNWTFGLGTGAKGGCRGNDHSGTDAGMAGRSNYKYGADGRDHMTDAELAEFLQNDVEALLS